MSNPIRAVRNGRRSVLLPVAGVLLVVLHCLTACSGTSPVSGTGTEEELDASSEQPFIPYDVRPLLNPRNKY